MYIVYKTEMYCFSLVCTIKKATKMFEGNIDLQKGTLRFT